MLLKLIAFLVTVLGTPAVKPAALPKPVKARRVAQAKPAEKKIPAAQPVPSPSPTTSTSTSATTGTSADQADQIVQAVQTFYQKTPHLTAKFRQTVVNKTFGIPTANDGKVYLKKPGKMRWDYFNKRNKTQVSRSQMSDGTWIWAVDKTGKWYYKQDLSKSALPVAVTFLTGKGNLKTDFTAALDKSGLYGGKTDHVLKLTPKKPSAQIKNLYLVVDPKDFRVKESVVVNAANDINRFRFYEPDTSKTVADTWFVFNPKAPATKGFREIKPEEAPK